jgi:PAS domain S-box-containing protein
LQRGEIPNCDLSSQRGHAVKSTVTGSFGYSANPVPDVGRARSKVRGEYCCEGPEFNSADESTILMHWNSIPDTLAVGLIVLVFLSIYSKRHSACTWNWIAGWIFIDAHFFCQTLMPSRAGLALTLLAILSTSALVVSGVLFFLATIELREAVRTQRLLAICIIVPGVLYLALSELLPRPMLLETIVVAATAGMFALWFRFFRQREFYSFALLAGSAVAFGWSSYGVLHGDLTAPTAFGLAGIYSFTAVSYWQRFRRFSPGVVLAVVGFVAWGSTFTLGAAPWFLRPGLLPENAGIWNIPQYFVAGAMMLTLLEDEIIAAKRLMRRYRLQFDRSLCGVYRCSAQGEMLECNDAFAQIFHRSREEMSAANLTGLLGGDLGSGRVFLERLATQSQVMGMEFAITTAAGAPRHLIGNASLVSDSPDAASEIEGTVLDITEFKNLQEQIRESQKLEALGLLAGGVAHDFNNLLMVISGHIEMLEELLNSDPQARATLEAVHNATQRGAAITGQLLAFSRKGPVEPKLLNMNSVLADARTLFLPAVGERIRLEVKPGEGRFDVLADENQMIMVLLNLVINARDAMPGGGRMVLESSSVDLDDSLARAHGLASAGNYVCVGVSDTGCGIPPEIKARVFDPFFTTKPPGKGTGLGLSICYGIIQQHGGTITIASSPGIGTTIRCYLPMAMAGADSATDARNDTAGVQDARILLVDDEEMLRKPACAFFQKAGFRATEASSSEEALRIFSEQEFDLVITDLVMPGMNGKELGDELKKRSPNLPVIYISGYAQDILERQGQLGHGDILLQKPYSLKRLVRLVEEELEKRGNVSVAANAGS